MVLLAAGSGIAPIRAAIESEALGLKKVCREGIISFMCVCVFDAWDGVCGMLRPTAPPAAALSISAATIGATIAKRRIVFLSLTHT